MHDTAATVRHHRSAIMRQLICVVHGLSFRWPTNDPHVLRMFAPVTTMRAGQSSVAVFVNVLRWPYHKSKISFAYSLRSVALGADRAVQAVSPQVTRSHQPGGMLPLISARPAVTFPAAEHHRPLGRYQVILLGDRRVGFEHTTCWSQVQRSTHCATAPPYKSVTS